MRSPPAMSLVRCVLVLFGLMSQMKLPYVMSFLLSWGIPSFLMKYIVFVPFTLPSLSPCARRPNSFVADLLHNSLCSGLQISWRYLRYSPVVASWTSWILSIGMFLRRFIWCLCGISALLFRAACRRSFFRALFTVCIGLSIVQWVLQLPPPARWLHLLWIVLR